MTLHKIFQFEFAYQARQVSTWLYLIVLIAFTIFMTRITAPGDEVYVNNTWNITAITVFGGFIWLIMCATIAGEAAARDVQRRMHSLTFTTPVTKLHYLGGRFLVAFSINSLLALSMPVGMLLSFYIPGMVPEGLGPLMPLAYLNVFFLIALPLVFIATALQFSFAVLSGNVMSGYLASLLLAIFAQVVAMAVTKLTGNWDLVKLLDPVGMSGIVGSELQTWTATEKNTRLIALEGMFLWNRILWLGIAIGFLLFAYFRFRFTNPVYVSWWSRLRWWTKNEYKNPPQTAIIREKAISVPQVRRGFNKKTRFRQSIAIALASFRKIAMNPVGLTLVAVIVLVLVALSDYIIVQLGIPVLPTTHQVLGYLTAPVGNSISLWIIIPLLIIYFAGQLVWNERDAEINDIADAAPVQDGILLTGKFVGLSCIIILWMALLLAGGVLMQLKLEYTNFDIGLYLQVLFGLQLADYLIFAMLAFAIQVVVNQKHIGFLVSFLLLLFIAFPSQVGIQHNMLIFGASPQWSYTDMRGFGTSIEPWLWFKAYWVGWTFLVAVAAKLLWSRGREKSLKYRLQLAKHRFKGTTTWVAISGAVLIVTMGSFIFYNTNVVNEYLTPSVINERKAEYERRYGRYRNIPQPQLTATKLSVNLFPDRQKVEINAAYTLVNNHSVPVDSIHLGSVSGIGFTDVHFNKPANSVVVDEELSHHIYVLEKQLQPGDTIQLQFEVNYNQRGFSNYGKNTLIMGNGTYFTNFDLLPSVGYQRNREISDAVIRKKHNLAIRPKIPSLYDAEARKKPLISDQTTLEAVISTPVEEIAVAPGILQKTWTDGERRHFHYKTDAPIGAEYSILSANYAVKESNWNDVAIRIYYHPDHAQSIEQMLLSAKASLDYYTEQFGPYPYENLTFVERAGAGGGATADAGIIYYGEQYPLFSANESPDGFNLPYYIIAHEVAHQWWGLARLTPANVEGSGVLIEGLAVYSGMQVLERNYGYGHLQKYLNYLHSEYEMPRSLATPSLLQANEEFLYYRKGGLAMYVLSKYVGKKKINDALRRLLQKRSSGELPLPTSIDLYEELQEVTPDSLNYLLHDLFKKNAYWRLKTKQFTVDNTEAGKWQVTLKVQAQKIEVDSTGVETEIPMNDWLEIGIFEDGKGLNEPLYLKMHRIRSGEQTIKVTVPRMPDRGGIDPNRLMIDLRFDDNIREVDM